MVKYFKDAEKSIIKANVNISTDFLTVIDINELNHIIELKFTIHLEWYETRTTYMNLKQNPALNVLNQFEEIGRAHV